MLNNLSNAVVCTVIFFIGLTVCEPAAAPEPLFTFVHLSDSHCSVNFTDYNENFRQTIAAVNALRPAPAFVLITGDLNTDSKTNNAFFKELLKLFQTDVYLSPGNHDTGNKISESYRKYGVYGKGAGFKGSLYSAEAVRLYGMVTEKHIALYEESFGKSWYSFDHLGAHFICYNSTILNSNFKSNKQQMAWLKEDLAEAARKDSKHIFMFAHYPLYLEEPDEPVDRNNYYYTTDPPARNEILALVEQYKVRAVMVGHLHNSSVKSYKDTKMISAPGIIYEPAYRIIEVHEDSIKINEPVWPELTKQLDEGKPDDEIITASKPTETVYGFEGTAIDPEQWEVTGTTITVADGAVQISYGPGREARLQRRGTFKAHTIELRARIETLPGDDRKWVQLTAERETGGPVWGGYVGTSGRYQIFYWNTQRDAGDGSHEFLLPFGAPLDYHIYKATTDGQTMQFYLDGKAVGSIPDTNYMTTLNFGSSAQDEAVTVTIDWVKIGLVE